MALTSELDEFKGAWQAIGRIAPERLSNLRHVATIESIGSSTRIEGAKLSDREVEQLLSNLDSQSFANRDEEEVAGQNWHFWSEGVAFDLHLHEALKQYIYFFLFYARIVPL